MKAEANKIEKIAELGDFPQEAVEFFSKLYEKAEKTEGAIECIIDTEKIYYAEGSVGEHMEKLAELMGENRYCTDMLFLLCCAVDLDAVYKEKGYSVDMYLGVLTDLKCKTIECHDVYGMWGTFVFSWFQWFFTLKRFCLGRLQYEIIESPIDYKDKLKKGEAVINCHIPSSGKLSPELVNESLKLAYGFFKCDGEMLVHCVTWMLFPEYKEAGVFPEGTNLRYFYDLFDIVEALPRDLSANYWRVFGTTEADLSKLPRDTGLRKRLADFLEKYRREGVGRGFLTYK